MCYQLGLIVFTVCSAWQVSGDKTCPQGEGRLVWHYCICMNIQVLFYKPTLYLSRYITQYQADYYRLLQDLCDEGASEQLWVAVTQEVFESTLACRPLGFCS